MSFSGRGQPKFQIPMKLRYVYEKSRDCPTVTAHGVWGGVNPHGEIEMNLYTESDQLPEFTEHVVNPDGSIGPELAEHPEETRSIVRTVVTKVLVNYQTARALIDWLQDKVHDLDRDSAEGSFLMDEGSGPAQ